MSGPYDENKCRALLMVPAFIDRFLSETRVWTCKACGHATNWVLDERCRKCGVIDDDAVAPYYQELFGEPKETPS